MAEVIKPYSNSKERMRTWFFGVPSIHLVKNTGDRYMWKGTYAYISISINCYTLYMQKLAPAHMEISALIEA